MKETEQASEANLQRARKLEDELAQYKQSTSKEIARLRQASTTVGGPTQKEEELENEVKSLMVRTMYISLSIC